LNAGDSEIQVGYSNRAIGFNDKTTITDLDRLQYNFHPPTAAAVDKVALNNSYGKLAQTVPIPPTTATEFAFRDAEPAMRRRRTFTLTARTPGMPNNHFTAVDSVAPEAARVMSVGELAGWFRSLMAGNNGGLSVIRRVTIAVETEEI
jgi:hypothetical protein